MKSRKSSRPLQWLWRYARAACGFGWVFCALTLPDHVEAAEPRNLSGIYPRLAMFNDEGECGTGAVAPWADRLWVISYAPHKPAGSTDKLYEITPGLEQIIRPESVGGTPANRMIHRESGQLFIGPYAIRADRSVRVIPCDRMFGRHTGLARHLTDPAGKIVFATMEEGIYEVDVKTLAVKEIWADEQVKTGRKANLPGYHGKGFYSAQGRYVYANNGDHAAEARKDPAVPSGCLAQWDGKAAQWTVIRRNQFTDVTGPGGINGNPPGDDRLWSIGWDHRSLILMLLDGGRWHAYRLPKASHCYDGAHGWNTEWPRIRDIGEEALLMTMHGSFWRFPRTFSAASSLGLAPRSAYLKVIGDFCRWNDRVVFGCDDTAQSEFLNKDRLKGNLAGPGKSQSNLWFVEPSRLGSFGPALGRGAVWLKDDVKAGAASEPFLFSGFAKRSLHLAHRSAEPVTFHLEVDSQGDGKWTKLRDVSVPASGNVWLEFLSTETGAWLRLTSSRDAAKATAFFHYRADDPRSMEAAPMFAGIALPGDEQASGGVLHARGAEFRTLRFVARNGSGELGAYDMDAHLELRAVSDPEGAAWTAKSVAIAAPLITADAASVLYADESGQRWRLPKGDPALDQPGPLGYARLCREVCTERNLLNVGGTFYEVPAENAGGFIKLRPIATHNRRIHDFASYRGLLVLSGVADGARGDHIIRSDDGKCALWAGAVDDLWSFGKPRGRGGPWFNSPVKANAPSDAYLATGFDQKRLTLSHASKQLVSFKVEADVAGTRTWSEVAVLKVEAGETTDYEFPAAFGAYWLRVTADADTTATAQFEYF
ncbi:MAG TPA: hypothetical protein P5555_09570 [Candidatus Paceibacterota bacterium]|nr:hypothetical protein [Verrucomicrobiota bacterium]HRZ45424.1 hypothetical protein [Candidatus Paceibacterota bacterium]HRZ55136.1 hypothetical protein [Candidatus Paceibacterota bacterium]